MLRVWLHRHGLALNIGTGCNLSKSITTNNKNTPASHGHAASLPLNIGVTGHRDLVPDELPRLRALVREWLQALQTRYPDLSLNVLSSLAVGADTLVAEVAAEMGVRVTNVLPMPYAHYREDFDEAERVQLDHWCTTNRTIELPLLASTGDSINRDLQYEKLGSFLASHCHILLALWDGTQSDAIGGTWQVVNFHQRDVSVLAQDQMRSQLDIRDDESDLVYHVVCSRVSTGTPTDLEPGTASWFTRDDVEPRVSELPERYHRVFEHMAQFNRDTALIRDPQALYRLEPQDVSAEAHTACEELQQVYAVSDGLATLFQRRMLWALRITLGAALLAGLCFIIYADFPDQEHMIWGYFVFVALAYGSYWLAQHFDWQRRHLDYRVLAEALRVQYYWALADVDMHNPSRFSHDSFFEGRDLQLGWIRNAMRHTGLQPDATFTPTLDDLDGAIRAWVGDMESGQLGYYQRRAGDKLRRHVTTQRTSIICFAAGLVAAAALALGAQNAEGTLSNWLVALMGSLPILAAARQNYAHRLAERELVAQYAHMREVFDNAHRLLERTQNPAQKRSVLRDLGDAALHENAQWILPTAGTTAAGRGSRGLKPKSSAKAEAVG